VDKPVEIHFLVALTSSVAVDVVRGPLTGLTEMPSPNTTSPASTARSPVPNPRSACAS
jgi:hypothetical protein